MNEEKLNKMTIVEIETFADDKRTCILGARFDLLSALKYLQTSGRWKENKRYAKEGFEKYLWDRHKMRITTLNREYYTFVKFPEAAKEYGTGVIHKIVNLCGSQKAPEVIQKVEEARKQGHGVIKSSKIEEIIQANRMAPPTPIVPVKHKMTEASEVNWKQRYEVKAKAYEEIAERLKAANATIKAQAEQIERLKATVRKMEEIRAILSGKPRQAEAQA